MTNKEQACGPDILATTGDPLYTHDNMLLRRNIAALAQQHREVQRFDKKIAILRASLGLPQLPPMRPAGDGLSAGRYAPHGVDTASDQGSAVSPWDRKWARGVTTRGVEAVASALQAKGYAFSRSSEDGVSTIRLVGHVGGKPDVIEMKVVAPSIWCSSVTRNGEALAGFSATPNHADAETASEDQPSTITASYAQAYVKSWVQLRKLLT